MICQVNIARKCHITCVDAKNVSSVGRRREWDLHDGIKPSRAQQCRVDGVNTICRGDDNDTNRCFNAIHFVQQS